MIYALLDRSGEIADDHVHAALAVWRYCNDSAAFLFGDRSIDPKINAVVEALNGNPDGMTRSQIHRDVFHARESAQAVARSLDALMAAGSIRCEAIETGGRPAQRYFAARPSDCALTQ